MLQRTPVGNRQESREAQKITLKQANLSKSHPLPSCSGEIPDWIQRLDGGGSPLDVLRKSAITNLVVST
jgi:hypothetical protein